MYNQIIITNKKIDEMKKAIEQRDITVQKFDEEKQNEINDYNLDKNFIQNINKRK